MCQWPSLVFPETVHRSAPVSGDVLAIGRVGVASRLRMGRIPLLAVLRVLLEDVSECVVSATPQVDPSGRL